MNDWYKKNKWFLAVFFGVLMIWGSVLTLLDKSPAVPAIAFVFCLILWCYMWLIDQLR